MKDSPMVIEALPFGFLGALHCKLLYELIGELVRRWGEIELALLSLLLRSVGPQLRADDPAALRDIIVQV